MALLFVGQAQAQSFPVTVLATYSTSCAVLWSQPLCWGNGQYYKLGTGRSLSVGDTPGSMASLSSIFFMPDAGTLAHISSESSYMCASFSSGRVTCWGNNRSFGCGIGGTGGPLDRSIPGDGAYCNNNPSTDDVRGRMVATFGGSVSCLLSYSGKISCWGGGNTDPCFIGRGGPGYSVGFDGAFVSFSDTILATFITSGSATVSCVLFVNSKLRCWGVNSQVHEISFHDQTYSQKKLGPTWCWSFPPKRGFLAL